MPTVEPEEGAEPLSLDTAKVVHIDREEVNRTQLEHFLHEIGFQHVSACDNLEQLADMLGTQTPDLVFIDVDGDPDAAYETIRGIRKSEVGDCPFAIVVALTKNPGFEVIQAALAAGADDMVVKPVTARALRERVVNQIENRKDFVATADYMGPDRRGDELGLTEDDPAAIEVPNPLRHAATGDETAAPSPERIKETLRSLSAQKFYHLSQKIVRIAGGQRDLLASDAGNGDYASAVEEITATLAEIDEIVGEQDFKSVSQVVASTREALAEIESSGGEAAARHFDLLCAHGGSIGVVLKESDETAGALVSALEKAVTVVKGGEGAADARAELEAASAEPEESSEPASDKSADSKRATAAPNLPGKIPFQIRLQAWWEGVDPAEIMTGAAR